MSGLSIVKSLELQLLRPTVTHDDVRAGCELASEFHLATVCVYPVHVALAASVLEGTDTRVCAAIGFPFGQEAVTTKLVSIERAQGDGAHEMAVMLDHSAIISGNVRSAVHEVGQIASNAFWSSLVSTRGRGLLTLVVETTMYDCAALTPLWECLQESPVDFLQTSSGHQSRAVTELHLREIRDLLPDEIAIKAVGGVHSLADASGLLAAGAVRVGTGSAIAIAEEERHLRQARTTG